MPSKFDEQRAQVDQLDARLRFQNQEANAREAILQNMLAAQAKNNQQRRKLGEQFIQSQLLDPAHANIDQREAAAEAQANAKPAPAVQPNAGMIPVPTNPSAVNPQAGGGIDPAALAGIVSGGAAVQAGPPEDMLNLNASDPTQGGKRLGTNYSQSPAGVVTQSTTSPVQTGIRPIDAINAIATAFGKPLLKATETVERPDIAMQIYNAKSQQAQNAAALSAQAEQEKRLLRAENRYDEQLKLDQKRYELAVKAQEFQAKQEARMANQQVTATAFQNFNDANSLRGQFIQLSQPVILKRTAAAQIVELGNNPSKAGDQALGFLAATLYQPDGRLSDKDVQILSSVGSLSDLAKNYFGMKVEGLRDEELRKNIVETALRSFDTQYNLWQDLKGQYESQADSHGFPRKDVTINILPVPRFKGAKPAVDKATGAAAIGSMEIP